MLILVDRADHGYSCTLVCVQTVYERGSGLTPTRGQARLRKLMKEWREDDWSMVGVRINHLPLIMMH